VDLDGRRFFAHARVRGWLSASFYDGRMDVVWMLRLIVGGNAVDMPGQTLERSGIQCRTVESQSAGENG
jgi:hypothetical protein